MNSREKLADLLIVCSASTISHLTYLLCTLIHKRVCQHFASSRCSFLHPGLLPEQEKKKWQCHTWDSEALCPTFLHRMLTGRALVACVSAPTGKHRTRLCFHPCHTVSASLSRQTLTSTSGPILDRTQGWLLPRGMGAESMAFQGVLPLLGWSRRSSGLQEQSRKSTVLWFRVKFS